MSEKVTFEQICKRWSKVVEDIEKLKEANNLDITVRRRAVDEMLSTDILLDYKSPAFCMVGEAHGFKADYFVPTSPHYCRGCQSFSIRFQNVAFWEWEIPLFVKHWNEKHV
jgi:hypothetical protein